MKGSTVVVVGAGFSKPAGGPLMAELFEPEFCHDYRISRPGFISGLKLDMRRRAEGRPAYSYEDYFSDIYREARTGGMMRFDDAAFGADQWLGEIVAHLASVTSKIRLRRNKRTYQPYARFFSSLPSRSTTFISFNYDLLVEQLLHDLEVGYTYGLPRPADGAVQPTIGDARRQMRVLKLHGSINWLLCRGCRAAGIRSDRISVLEKAYVPHQRKTCPSCGERKGEVAIVPPIYGKAGESGYLVDVWKKARAELREAARVIVIGYSLPPSDLEARSLLKEIGMTERPPPTLLVAGKSAGRNYSDVVPTITDSGLFAEEFFEHMDFASGNGIESYRREFDDAIPGFGRFYTPQVAE